MKQIHLVIPFSRPELKDKLIEVYRPMNIVMHPIMFRDEKIDFPNELWIQPFVSGFKTTDCKAMMPGTFKRNQWIQIKQENPYEGIIDDDYYVTADDDDMYEPGVFDTIKQMDDDIVIISMKRGNNIPENAPPIRRYPTDTLYARPEFVLVGMISAQQSFVKGKIFREHLHNEESHNWDGELICHHKEHGEQIAYRPDLFALFNYYEPERWEERRKMISIVIPVYHQEEMTKACLKAVRSTVTTEFEIVIVDNGNEDEESLDGYYEGNTTIIQNKSNLGFPVAVNQGIRAAHGDTIILLNNDVIVTPGWATRLTKALDDYSIVSPMTNYCAGLQRTQVGIYENENELNEQAEKWSEEHKGETQEVSFVIGFCMVFKKALFDEIGLFDESLWPCSGEEIDFCLRARKAGYRVAIVKDVYVHHEGSQTFGDLMKAARIDYKELCKRNDNHLIETWGFNPWERQAVNA